MKYVFNNLSLSLLRITDEALDHQHDMLSRGTPEADHDLPKSLSSTIAGKSCRLGATLSFLHLYCLVCIYFKKEKRFVLCTGRLYQGRRM